MRITAIARPVSRTGTYRRTVVVIASENRVRGGGGGFSSTGARYRSPSGGLGFLIIATDERVHRCPTRENIRRSKFRTIQPAATSP